MEICNCKFSIRWSEGPMRGTETTLKCPDISLIVARNIDHHPVVSVLLKFAKDHPVVTPGGPQDVEPVLSLLAKPDASPPGHKLSSQRSPELVRMTFVSKFLMSFFVFTVQQISHLCFVKTEKLRKNVQHDFSILLEGNIDLNEYNSCLKCMFTFS